MILICQAVGVPAGRQFPHQIPDLSRHSPLPGIRAAPAWGSSGSRNTPDGPQRR